MAAYVVLCEWPEPLVRLAKRQVAWMTFGNWGNIRIPQERSGSVKAWALTTPDLICPEKTGERANLRYPGGMRNPLAALSQMQMSKGRRADLGRLGTLWGIHPKCLPGRRQIRRQRLLDFHRHCELDHEGINHTIRSSFQANIHSSWGRADPIARTIFKVCWRPQVMVAGIALTLEMYDVEELFVEYLLWMRNINRHPLQKGASGVPGEIPPQLAGIGRRPVSTRDDSSHIAWDLQLTSGASRGEGRIILFLDITLPFFK